MQLSHKPAEAGAMRALCAEAIAVTLTAGLNAVLSGVFLN